MATINYILLPTKKDGTTSVAIQISHLKKRKRISTDIVLDKSEVSRSGKILSFDKLAKIEELLNQCRRTIADISADKIGCRYDVDYIVSRLSAGKHTCSLNFFDFANKWVEQSNLQGKPNYRSMLKSLSSYCGGEHLYFDQITYSFLKSYEQSLSGLSRAPSLYLGAIRHIFREAIKTYNTDDAQVIKNDPFVRYQVPKMKMNFGGKRALSLAEMIRIIQYKSDNPLSRAQLARDCFVLSFCLMGMNSVDLYSVKKSYKGIIKYCRTKTKMRREDEAYIEVVIHPRVMPLVEKYKDNSRMFRFYRRYSTPQSYNKHLNIGLKEVGQAVGIRDLQFYQARHTFATLSRNLMKFSKSDVDEALNHVGDHSIADVYIKKDFTIINDNNRKLLDYVFAQIG